MTSLFEPAGTPPPPHTNRLEDDPWVRVQHGAGWYDAILWGWTWDPRLGVHWGYVDYWVGTKHHMCYVHQEYLLPARVAERGGRRSG